MRALARQLVKKSVAWAVVVITLGVCGALALQAVRVDQSDDLLAFLPRSNSDVAAFYDLNKRFGGLDIAIVGIAVDDPFEAEFLTKLKQLTEQLNSEKAIGHALSLANVEDFREDTEKGGIRTDRLVSRIPKTAAAKAAPRRAVSARRGAGRRWSWPGKRRSEVEQLDEME